MLFKVWFLFFFAAVFAQDPPASGGQKLVFAHFMIGIVSDRTSASDYDADMQRAKDVGIDAFALNIGVDPYTDTQLGLAYESANNNGMKCFISFDFNWFHPTSDAGTIGAKVAQFAKLPAQLMIDGKPLVSSFAGDGLDVGAVRSAAGMDILAVLNFHPQQSSFADLDGALSWQGWDTNGNNKAPVPGGPVVTTTDGDSIYTSALAGKPYLAPAAAWFFTHYGPEVSYSKNWVFPGDSLWFRRWGELLKLQPQMIEILTWNDYGESHYVAPLSSPHTDDGASKWVNDMPHDGWLDMAKPFIAAYKAGDATPDAHIDTEQLIYWYRVLPKAVDCDSTDTTMAPADNSTGNYYEGRPDGYDTLADQVFVVALLKSPGTVTVNSGGTLYTFDAPAGASSFGVDFKVGPQAFSLIRDGQPVEGMSATSLKEISNECPCGLYNYNAYVGTVPPGQPDALSGPGFAAFSTALKVACDPTPSLPANPPDAPAPTATISVSGGSATAGASTNTATTTTSESTSTPTSSTGSSTDSNTNSTNESAISKRMHSLRRRILDLLIE